MPVKRLARALKAVKRPVLRRTKTATAPKNQPLDLSAFPPESVTQLEKWICLACVLDLFTRHMGLALKTANLEIKRYTPQLAEVNTPEATRPYFAAPSSEGRCPYCGSPSKWHAKLAIYRIESGKATDALRRQLVESLPTSDDQFVVLQEKATQQHAFFEWLEKVSIGLNLENPSWVREISRHYLSRKEPKVDWVAQMRDLHSIRRSRRLETGWESDHGRLFLAPLLFDELLVVQYLVSRSQKAGGLTLEGRYTLPELVVRLRNSGYLRAIGIHAHHPADVFEALLDHLSGGQASVKFYYLVDRRGLLEKAKALRLVKPPRLKKLAAP